MFQWGTTTAYGNSTPLLDAGSGAGGVEAKGAAREPDAEHDLPLPTRRPKTNSARRAAAIAASPPPPAADQLRSAKAKSPTRRRSCTQKWIPTSWRPNTASNTGQAPHTAPKCRLGAPRWAKGKRPWRWKLAFAGLKIGTVYHYRVVAENSDRTTVGPDQTFETIPPAPVDATYATGVNTSEATLNAQIDPLGNETTYLFQYGTESCMANPVACTEIPIPPAVIGSGTGDVAEKQLLVGLKPATTYYYRVLDHNVLGTTEGVQRAFTTQPLQAASVLPDGREWEMVSPPEKYGAPIEPLTREGGWILSRRRRQLADVRGGRRRSSGEPEGNRSPEVAAGARHPHPERLALRRTSRRQDARAGGGSRRAAGVPVLHTRPLPRTRGTARGRRRNRRWRRE